MPSGGTPFNPLTYKRKIRLLSADGATEIAVLCDLSLDPQVNLVESLSFSWLRQGGCGSGRMSVVQSFLTNTSLVPGRLIEVSYADTPWYLGEIQSVSSEEPSGLEVSLNGLISRLDDLFVGGPGFLNSAVPLRLSRENYYPSDPNAYFQNAQVVNTVHDAVNYFYTNYLAPLGIGNGGIPAPSTNIDIYSLTFTGEQSLSDILRVLAEAQYNASYGINAAGNFFFTSLDEAQPHLDTTTLTPQAEFTRNLDLTRFRRIVDREGMINRISLVGGYVFGMPGNGFFRFYTVGEAATSVAAHGARSIEAYVPFIRNNFDAQVWLDGVFRRYSNPRVRYEIQTKPQSIPLYPWAGPIKLFDSDGTTVLATSHFDEVSVEFDTAPYFAISTGPEDFQYEEPPEAASWEPSSGGAGGGGGGGDNGRFPPTGTTFSDWNLCEGSPEIEACTLDKCAYEYAVTLTGIGAVQVQHDQGCNWKGVGSVGGDDYDILLTIGGNGAGTVLLDATAQGTPVTDYSVSYSNVTDFRELCCTRMAKTGGYSGGEAFVNICATATQGPGEGCDEVDEFVIVGSPSGGNLVITWSLDPEDDGSPVSDTITIAHNATNAQIRTAFEAHSEIVSTDFDVLGGPLPFKAFHIIWKGRYAKRVIPAPAGIDPSGLTGTNISANWRKSSSFNWQGYGS